MGIENADKTGYLICSSFFKKSQSAVYEFNNGFKLI